MRAPPFLVYLTDLGISPQDIMSLANLLIYSGQLRCGDPAVGSARLAMPRLAAVSSMLRQHLQRDATGGGSPSGAAPGAPISSRLEAGRGLRPSCWVSDLLDPACTVVFINTDALPARDTRPSAGPVE